MPKFTLTKHPDNQFDAEVTVTFEAELLGTARDHYDDFLKAAGFDLPIEEPELDLTHAYNIPDPSDWLWDDAFKQKFAGADVIDFPTKDD